MELIDIGANLTHDAFAHDIDQVIRRATAAQVTQMIVTGTNLQHAYRAAELARKYRGTLFATAGIHPHHAKEASANSDTELRALVAGCEVVAIGECGLDYFRDIAPRAVQQTAFERQLELAVATKKPLFLHQRDAHQDFLAIMRSFATRLGPAVVHCFTGTREELFTYLDHGWFIGLTGWLCDERRGTHLRALVKAIPSDRLMLETDAPYLLPRTLHPRPKDGRNEPCLLIHLLAEIAKECHATPDQIAQQTTQVARSFFNLPLDPMNT